MWISPSYCYLFSIECFFRCDCLSSASLLGHIFQNKCFYNEKSIGQLTRIYAYNAPIVSVVFRFFPRVKREKSVLLVHIDNIKRTRFASLSCCRKISSTFNTFIGRCLLKCLCLRLRHRLRECVCAREGAWKCVLACERCRTSSESNE